jgi:hypothetical protein
VITVSRAAPALLALDAQGGVLERLEP